MLKIGLTGGIGSGKTLVSEVFFFLGINTYYADKYAKYIYFNDNVKKEIIKLLGAKTYTKNGELNKKYIANKIFNNKKLLENTNNIIHPFVKKNYDKWLLTQKNKPYILKETAILFESRYYKNMDKIIIVLADKESRIKRVMKRDNILKKEVLDKINNQLDDTKKISMSNFIIYNDSKKSLIKQVLKIHHYLLEINLKNE